MCVPVGGHAASPLQRIQGSSTSWVWSQSPRAVTPLPAIDGQDFQPPTPPLDFHFDDGSVGRVAVERRACESSDGCAPGDCGNDDNALIQVKNSAGQRVATWLRCAAYGNFSLVPVDLIDGPGDELIFLYRYGRSSPPRGVDLTMWSLRSSQPESISDTIRVADYVSTACGAVACVWWQMRLVVGENSRRPRRITLRAAFEPFNGSMANLDRLGRREAAALGATPVLVYRDGRYRVEQTNSTGRQLLKGADQQPQGSRNHAGQTELAAQHVAAVGG